MALNISESQFVLPSGADASQNAAKVGQLIWSRNMAKQRLEEAKEAKRDTAGKFLESYLDPKHYLTGSEYDPVVTSKLNGIMQKASGMAQQGADIPSLLMAIGPDVSDVSQYSAKAKYIDQSIKDNLTKLKDYKGYNQDAILEEAKKMAFHEIDPKTGGYGALKDINKVDPSMNFVQEAIKAHPERTTTGAGIENFINTVPMSDYQKSVQTAYGGRTKTATYEAKHPFYMGLQKEDNGQVSVDKNGNPVGLDVNSELAHGDDGKPIADPATGGAYRVAAKDDYQTIMHLHPDIADNMRGEVKKAFQDAGKDMPAEGSQQWELMARHILYSELKHNDKSHFKTVEQQKESSPVMKMEMGQSYIDMLRNESRARKEGNLEAQDEAGISPKQKPLNVAQTTNEIFNNNPDYLNGDATKVNGRRVIDVTGSYQGAAMRFGHGDKEEYDKVYYDPAKRVLITQDKDFNIAEHKESEMPQFLQKIAGANKINPASIQQTLAKGGFKNGVYSKPADASSISDNLQQQDVDEKRKALDDFFTSGKADGLKKLDTPEGHISDAGEQGIFSKGKYYLKVKSKDGKEAEKVFGTKKQLENYVLGEEANPSTAPVAAPATSSDKEKKYDEKISKYEK